MRVINKKHLYCLTNSDEMAACLQGWHITRVASLISHSLKFIGPPTRQSWVLQQELAAEELAWSQSKEKGFAMAIERILSKHQ